MSRWWDGDVTGWRAGLGTWSEVPLYVKCYVVSTGYCRSMSVSARELTCVTHSEERAGLNKLRPACQKQLFKMSLCPAAILRHFQQFGRNVEYRESTVVQINIILLIPCMIIIQIQHLSNQCAVLMSLHYNSFKMFTFLQLLPTCFDPTGSSPGKLEVSYFTTCTVKAVCVTFNFLTSSVPDDDPVGSKHVGRSCKNVNILKGL
jgi:hypothetical protein